MKRIPVLLSVTGFCFMLMGTGCTRSQLGTFEGHSDIGTVAAVGTIDYNPDEDSYHVGGGGENMWYEYDDFHFVWKKMSGDFSIASDIEILGDGGHPHRKAFLMIRQNLDTDSPYADAVIHGKGMASLQYRETAGDASHEVQSNVHAPRRLSLHKEGDYVYMKVANEGEELRSSGGMFRIKFQDPFYVGIGVCAHDSTRFEEAVFTNLEITTGAPEMVELAEGEEPAVESTLERIAIGSTDRTVIYHTRGRIEAPNWTGDGEYLIYNSNGLLYKIPVAGGIPEQIDTGFATALNNDHGISPDGSQLVVSDNSGDGLSKIYVLPAEGGTPRPVMTDGPAYWHGWSPDGQTLAYVARRNDDFDIYTIPVSGGEEVRLTTAPGLDDGPDYSPDGKYIYFNSVRTGTMQLYRMRADGSEQEQMTTDEYNDWFPHPSPDGKWLVFISFEPEVEGHPRNKDVMLRMMPAEGGEIKVLAKLFGGQGTINVPSWSPDSEHVAFVSYRLVNP
ncbi:MAG: TolB family protein [Rhodothermales bacterium]